MNTKNKTEQVNKKGTASQAQLNLIKEIYKETDYSRQYPDEELLTMTKEEASKHIDAIKGSKELAKLERTGNYATPSLSEPVLGMCFKMAFRSLKAESTCKDCSQSLLREKAMELYHEYQVTKQQLYNELKGGGQK